MQRLLRERFKRLEELGWSVPIPGGGLVRYQATAPKPRTYDRAAVLFVVSQNDDGELQVLLTKRSNSVRIHKGEICLPGGHQDNSSEGPVETALREAKEEIQLDPSLVDVVAVLPPWPSGHVHLLAVTPVVCTLLVKPKELSLVPNDEVEYIFWVPLRRFLEGKDRTVLKVWWHNLWFGVDCFHVPEAGKDASIPTASYSSPVVSRREQFGVRTVWGLTAQICVTVSAMVLNRVPEFPSTGWVIKDIDEASKTMQLERIAYMSHQLKDHTSFSSTVDMRSKL